MDVYILDSLYRRTAITDKYESLIWTERHRAFGDFELILNSTLENRNRFKADTRLAIAESQRVMIVQNVIDAVDEEGRRLLTISGRSIECILEDRVARGALEDTTTTPKWVLTGTPVEIAEQIFHDICITGVLDAGDIIDNVLEDDDIFPVDTIDPPADTITYEIPPMTVYKAIKDLCDVYNIGFRLCRNGDTLPLRWDVYTGSDRTTSQTVLPAVVFSSNLDNLQNTKELTTSSLFKNVAYVFSPVGYEIVYPLDVDPDVEGFERHVLLINATDIDDPDPPTASAQMIQRANEELAKARRVLAFDGEISTTSQYQYGSSYNLGDLVEVRNTDGASNVMQVTEHIFVSDKEGVRGYPTLTLNTFITPGSWISMGPVTVWDDFDTEHWDELP